jgi:Ni,Fe-hydrogenase maturation factor
MTVLVIGYGNPLRSDDGAGWHAAQALSTDEGARRGAGAGDSPAHAGTGRGDR